jgi:hypothetical protein
MKRYKTIDSKVEIFCDKDSDVDLDYIATNIINGCNKEIAEVIHYSNLFRKKKNRVMVESTNSSTFPRPL